MQKGTGVCVRANCNGKTDYKFCTKHKDKTVAEAKPNTCNGSGCPNRPSFGVPRSLRTEYCKLHHLKGMVVLAHLKKCSAGGCRSTSSYGTAGTSLAFFCKEHAVPGMVNVVTPRCNHPGCETTKAFGTPGTKKREFCGTHKKDGMVCLG